MLQVATIAEQIGPKVVGLGRGWGHGSGVVVAPDTVLTSAHALRGQELALRLNGAVVHGRVETVIADLRLAVVAADTGGIEPIRWEPDAVELAIGTPVVALADPGGRGLRATPGTVSAAPTRRSIEHTAPLPLGSAGGPLVDLEGRLVGINSVRMAGGLILAAPAGAQVKAIVRGERVSRPRLGVALSRGLVVRAVQDASAAAVAGVVAGDRLLAADDRPLRSVDDLFDVLETVSEVTLTVERGGAQRDITVVLQ